MLSAKGDGDAARLPGAPLDRHVVGARRGEKRDARLAQVALAVEQGGGDAVGARGEFGVGDRARVRDERAALAERFGATKNIQGRRSHQGILTEGRCLRNRAAERERGEAWKIGARKRMRAEAEGKLPGDEAKRRAARGARPLPFAHEKC